VSRQPAGASDRTKLRRLADRGAYDLETVKSVLDSQQVCHVAYVVDGEPRIIPTLYLRRDDHVYLHGNRQSALLKHLGAGGFACLSVMSLDGVVVARSGFHCSMNYRSAVVFGNGEAVADDERESILDAFVEALLPGHQNAVRAATPQELNATGVVRLPLTETSTKIRTGPPVDAPGDLSAEVWAGVIPLETVAGEPEPSPDLDTSVEMPDYIRDYRPPS
jgi:nitroimidazol reductase NimA-like FMN-containing flavoprotein (pyridoxamine 5'-phosphate oxidase superfamily)